jgi:signal transduction histidine kinase
VFGLPTEEEDGLRLPERRFRTDAGRDRARLSVLAEVSLLLSSSDDYVTILQKLTEMAVPTLGDWCFVHVINASGALERVAIRHSDPKKLEIADVLARATRLDPNAGGAPRIFATGRSECVEHITEEFLVEHVGETWQRDAARALGLRSYIGVPLHVRGRVTGVLTLVRSETSPVYDADDLAFAEELARRVAMYVDNAMLLREIQARESALRDEAARLEILNRIGQELAAIHDLDEVVKKVCEAATALTGADVGTFFTLAGDEPKYALCGATFNEAAEITARSNELSHASPELALQGVLRIDDVRTGTAHSLGMLAGLPRVVSYLAVPVRGRRGDVIGGIALGHSRPGAFNRRAEQLVIGLASLTATATDSARLFREARELITALEKSNRDLDQFAYVTSHDLRAPLRGIANLSAWVEEDLGDRITDAAREHLRLLRTRVQRLEDIIQGVLDYSRAGVVDDDPVDVEVDALVREVVELLTPAAGPVDIRIAPHLPTVRTTRVPLEQVFMNLIANALKYNTEPAPHVEIGVEPIADGWEFYVRDNGPGISPRYHARVWGLFQTLHSRDQLASTGIGLAIVRKIVEAHGGRVWIESEEGRGATFRFTWPKAPTSRRWQPAPVLP